MDRFVSVISRQSNSCPNALCERTFVRMTPPTSRRNFLIASGSTLLAAAIARGANDPASKKKLGWAVMGLGRLALGEVMPAFAKCELSTCTALVSGHPDKANDTARKYNVDPKNIYNYE